MQNLWEESIQMNHATRFTDVCARQLLLFVPLFHAQIKHVLIYFTPEIAAIIIARRE